MIASPFENCRVIESGDTCLKIHTVRTRWRARINHCSCVLSVVMAIRREGSEDLSGKEQTRCDERGVLIASSDTRVHGHSQGRLPAGDDRGFRNRMLLQCGDKHIRRFVSVRAGDDRRVSQRRRDGCHRIQGVLIRDHHDVRHVPEEI